MEKLIKRIETSLKRLEYEIMRSEISGEEKIKVFEIILKWKNQIKDRKEVKNEVDTMGEVGDRNSSNNTAIPGEEAIKTGGEIEKLQKRLTK